MQNIINNNNNTQPFSDCLGECFSERMMGNYWRVSAAGVISFVGGVFPLAVPGVGGVVGGAVFGGIGNGLSTIYAYNTKKGQITEKDIEQLKNENIEIKEQLWRIQKLQEETLRRFSDQEEEVRYPVSEDNFKGVNPIVISPLDR